VGETRRPALTAPPAPLCWQIIGGFYQGLRAGAGEAQEAATRDLLQAYARLSAEYARHGGPYFAGERLSLTDVLVWPWIARLSVLRHYRAFSVPDEPAYAAFHRFAAAMRARPAVQKTQAEDDFFIQGYASYVK
jgi:glutathione S-transferase